MPCISMRRVERSRSARYSTTVPVMSWPAAPRRLVRISAQLYNSREQYRALAQVLGEALGGE